MLAAHLHRVCGAVALQALEVSALPTPWLPHDPTTLTLSGAEEEGEPTRPQHSQRPARPVPPRPASGPSQDGPEALHQVLLSLGVSSDGLPLRLGVRAGTTRDRLETPVAIEEGVALGLDGVRGIGAERKAYWKRTLGLGLANLANTSFPPVRN